MTAGSCSASDKADVAWLIVKLEAVPELFKNIKAGSGVIFENNWVRSHHLIDDFQAVFVGFHDGKGSLRNSSTP